MRRDRDPFFFGNQLALTLQTTPSGGFPDQSLHQMKSRFILFLFPLAMGTKMIAQVTEDVRMMSEGNQNALTILLPGTSAKYAEEKWAEFVKAYGKMTSIKKSREKVVSGIQMVEVSRGSTLSVYSLADELGKDTRLLTWWHLDSTFISSTKNPEAFANAAKKLEEFAFNVKVAHVSDEIAVEQKGLERMKSDLSKLQKENTGLHKDIDTYTKKIEQAEKTDIPSNLASQEQARTAIAALQTSALGELEQKELSKQMKILDKLTKENDGLHRAIRDYGDRIAKARRDIEHNLTDQDKAKTAVARQEKVLADIQQKLLDVKAQKPK